jgi:hypothetical protein
MKINILDRMVMALVITTLSLAGISIAADGQREPQEEQKRDQQEKQQPQKQEQKQERVQKKSEQDQKQQQQRVQQQQQQDQGQQQKQQQRLSQQQQQKLISQQQQRVVQYRQHLEQQQALAQQNAVLLQQQKRIAQYRFQEQYLDRVRQQQIHLRDDRFDYARDPYFYTAPIYRYNRGGSYYETNEYGAKTLRQAVNYGYEAGFRAGKADRDDRWGSNYKDSYAYSDANYGYSGYYVDRSDYNYYFRQGFRRGYEDGYNSRYQYGRFANGIIPSWIPSCHKSSISRLFADDQGISRPRSVRDRYLKAKYRGPKVSA